MGKFVSTHEYLSECPICGKRKLYFNTVKEVGWCHRCERAFFKRDGIVIELEGRTESVQGRRYYDNEKTTLAWLIREAREYLESRNVQPLDALTTGIEYRRETSEILVPVTAPSPEYLTAFMRRKINDRGWFFEGGDDKKPYAFGWEYLGGRRSCVLVEGIFDVLSPGLLGYGIALLGTRLHELLLIWLEHNVDFCHIWLDPGEMEEHKAERISQQLGCVGIANKVLKMKQEPGDCKAYDPRIKFVKRQCDV